MFRTSEEGIMQPERRFIPIAINSELFVHLYKKAKKENSTMQDILENIIQEYMNTHNIKE